MKHERQIWIRGIVLALIGLANPAGAEIVERELGVDSEGKAVTGFVFQAGRGFGRSGSRRSSLPARWISRRGLNTGYRYPCFYVPFVSVHYGAPFSFYRVSSHRFSGASFSVRGFR